MFKTFISPTRRIFIHECICVTKYEILFLCSLLTLGRYKYLLPKCQILNWINDLFAQNAIYICAWTITINFNTNTNYGLLLGRQTLLMPKQNGLNWCFFGPNLSHMAVRLFIFLEQLMIIINNTQNLASNK